MQRVKLRERMKQGLFLLDGAMGTQLMASEEVETGQCKEYLNISSGRHVLEMHHSYINCGSDAILTNTFGGNRITLGRHNLDGKVEEINKAGVQLARQAAGENRYVLGDIGPTGDFLEPFGTLKVHELKEAFCQQAESLDKAGADGFILETMTSADEISIAIQAVKSISKLPILASLAFDRANNDFRTIMGIGVERGVGQLIALGVDAVGFNCGKMKLDDYVELAKKYAEVSGKLGQDISLFAELNAGIPELVGEQAVYHVQPDEFADACRRIYSCGVSMIGGCCGTGPPHIKAMAKLLRAVPG